MSEQELIEALAEKEHASWARWMHYLFSKCTRQYDGTYVIPHHLVTRWRFQIETPYAELSEQEKQSDRDEVAHILPIIHAYMGSKYEVSPLTGLLHPAIEDRDEED